MTNQEELSNLTELIFDLHNCITVWKNRPASETNLSKPQLNALEIIGHNFSLNMKDLAERLGVTTGTLTVMIDRLEKKGLVQRKLSDQDRRSIMVALTEGGRSLYLVNYRQQLEFTKKALGHLLSADKKLLSSSLKNIIKTIAKETQ